MSSFRLGAMLVVIGGAGLGAGLSAQQAPSRPAPSRFTGRAIQATHHYFSPALRDIPPDPDAREDKEQGAHAPLRVPRSPRAAAGFRDQAVQESAPAALLAPPTVSFDGINNRDGVLPPDVNGDAGPNHYVQWVNLSVRGLQQERQPRLVATCSRAARCSPVRRPVLQHRTTAIRSHCYDELADRWMAVAVRAAELSVRPVLPVHRRIKDGRSRPASTGRYEFKISDTKLNDYPKFGVWPNGYFMFGQPVRSATLRSAPGSSRSSATRCLQGLAARMYRPDVDTHDPTLGGMLPYGPRWPGAPCRDANNFSFMQFDDVPASAAGVAVRRELGCPP